MTSSRVIASIWLVFAVFFYLLEDSIFAFLFLMATMGTLLLSVILAAVSARRYELTFHAPAEIPKGEAIPAEVRLKNKSLIPIGRFTFEMICENAITGQVYTIPISLSAGPKRTSNITFTLEEEYCGYIEYYAREPRVSDVFNIFSMKRENVARKATYVMPRIQEMMLESDELNQYDMESYVYSSTQKGNDPSETFGIREYMPGDSHKTIHWKLTGKMDEIMVRELGLPVENSIMVLLDKRLLKGTTLEAGLRDHATELFLSLSQSLIKKGMAHSVGWQDYRNHQFILKRVSTQLDIWEILTLVLESPYQGDHLSTIVHYLESFANEKFANYLYVTAGAGSDKARLEGHGAITIYRAEEWK